MGHRDVDSTFFSLGLPPLPSSGAHLVHQDAGNAVAEAESAGVATLDGHVRARGHDGPALFTAPHPLHAGREVVHAALLHARLDVGQDLVLSRLSDHL